MRRQSARLGSPGHRIQSASPRDELGVSTVAAVRSTPAHRRITSDLTPHLLSPRPTARYAGLTQPPGPRHRRRRLEHAHHILPGPSPSCTGPSCTSNRGTADPSTSLKQPTIAARPTAPPRRVRRYTTRHAALRSAAALSSPVTAHRAIREPPRAPTGACDTTQLGPSVCLQCHVAQNRVMRGDQATVVGVSVDGEHRFSKTSAEAITLLEGLGVRGDAHAGVTVQHRSHVAVDPTQPNLPRGTHLHIGGEAVVEVTGLRNPCAQINAFRPGLLSAVRRRDQDGVLVRKAGITSIVVRGGLVRPSDCIGARLPTARSNGWNESDQCDLPSPTRRATSWRDPA